MEILESTTRQISHREASLIAPPGSENKQAAVVDKLCGSKAKKRCVSRDVHASPRNTLVADLTRLHTRD